MKDVKVLQNAIVRVSVWHDPLLGERVFMGQVNLSIGTCKHNWNHSGWHELCPRPTPPDLPDGPELGSLRLKVKYSQDVIYPLEVYETLSHFLVETTVIPVSLLPHNDTVRGYYNVPASLMLTSGLYNMIKSALLGWLYNS